MSDHQRFDLDAAMNEGKRRAIDADWSARKKALVGVSAAAVAACAIGGSAWAYMRTRTPSLPTTINQAMAVLASDKLDRMAPERRAQYTEEARRILWSLTDEERRKLFEDEKSREALRAIREQTMDDLAYRIARGEQVDWSQFGPPRREMTDEERQRMREEWQRMQNATPEERAARMEEMRNRMANEMRQQLATGNAQSGALRGEMMGRGGRGGAGGPGGRGGMGGRPGGAGQRGTR